MAAARPLAAVALAAILALPAFVHAGYGVTTPMPVPNADAEVAAEALRQGEWQRAVDNFRAALKAEPDNADFHNGLGYAYRKLGDYGLAFASLRRALRLDPTHRSAHENLGEALLAIGDVGKAREQLAALAELCPGRSCQEYVDLERAITAAK